MIDWLQKKKMVHWSCRRKFTNLFGAHFQPFSQLVSQQLQLDEILPLTRAGFFHRCYLCRRWKGRIFTTLFWLLASRLPASPLVWEMVLESHFSPRLSSAHIHVSEQSVGLNPEMNVFFLSFTTVSHSSHGAVITSAWLQRRLFYVTLCC